MRVPLPVEEIGVGDWRLAVSGGLSVERDELAWMRIRQWIEQHAIHDRKKGGVRADAQGQSENGDGGERGRFGEHSKGVTNILTDAAQKSSAVLSWRCRFAVQTSLVSVACNIHGVIVNDVSLPST